MECYLQREALLVLYLVGSRDREDKDTCGDTTCAFQIWQLSMCRAIECYK